MRTYLSELLLYICNYIIRYLPSRRIRLLFYKKGMGFDLAPNTFIFIETYFTSRKHFKTLGNTVINAGCYIDTRALVSIGRNVSISPRVTILTGDHDVYDKNVLARFRPVTIGDNVFIGYGAILLPGITVAEGAVICAGSVVTKDVGAYEIVGGVPGKKVAMRPSQIEREMIYSRLFS